MQLQHLQTNYAIAEEQNHQIVAATQVNKKFNRNMNSYMIYMPPHKNKVGTSPQLLKPRHKNSNRKRPFAEPVCRNTRKKLVDCCNSSRGKTETSERIGTGAG